ncbi:MAG: electron transfer flavoprotein beta subunit [Chloroflexota bacterium]|nr:electron transfer flavoprotein beta subunit [Chloroflexota bacterium]
MHVVVCGKVIPDINQLTLRIDPDTKRLHRKDEPHILDPAAAVAVEEALQLVEQHGGSISFVTMGPSDAATGIRTALALISTANIPAAAVHLLGDEFAGSDTLGTAKALAAAIKQLPPFDLIICGTEASDTYAGIVPAQLAWQLGIPPLTFANKVVGVEGNTLTINRQSETGYAVVKADLPALVSVTSGLNEPRNPSLKGIMAARKVDVQTYSASQLGLGPDDVGASAARERVETVGAPEARKAGRILESDGQPDTVWAQQAAKEVADFLASLKVI